MVVERADFMNNNTKALKLSMSAICYDLQMQPV